MDLTFEQGDSQRPRGHALLYFADSSTSGSLLTTYLIVLPVAVDLSRYLPPVFLSQVQSNDVDVSEISTFAFPPVPECVGSHDLLNDLAGQRQDDLIYGGTLPGNDPRHSMSAVNEAVQQYAQLCRNCWDTLRKDDPVSTKELAVSDVLYELMSPRTRLEELAKLLGRLRFAQEGPDPGQSDEVEAEILNLARYFPEHYRIQRLATVARQPGMHNQRLAELYLDRCYRLLEEEYLKAQDLEQQIAHLESTE
jgi:hypothetical protein